MTLALRRSFNAILLFAMAFSSLVALPAFAQDTESEETFTSVNFGAQLIEVASTDIPTTYVARSFDEDGNFVDYTVDVDADTDLGDADMADWIAGDWVTIWGSQNDNTDVVTATKIINRSMDLSFFRGLNGWITEIDTDASTMTVQWDGEEHVVTVTDDTRMVVPPVNPATLSDFEINDRVRVRIKKDSDLENEASIVLALRRGDKIFNLARTRGFWAEIDELDTENDLMNVTITKNDHLRDGDVNNLLGVEGDTVTVTWDVNTKFVRRYLGSTTEDELAEGDSVFLVVGIQDDGTALARLIKDNSIFRRNVAHHVGNILSVDTEANSLTVSSAKNDTDRVWTILYTDETVFMVNGEEAGEDDLVLEMYVRVRGTANAQLSEVTADKITASDEDRVLEHHEARITDQVTDEE